MSVTAFVLIITSLVNAYTCENLSTGFYCVDEKTYLWCYGRNDGVTGTCPGTTICKCGKTQYNPCVWTWTEVPDCERKPGDFFDGSSDQPESSEDQSSSELPEQSSSTPPPEQSSSEPPREDSSESSVGPTESSESIDEDSSQTKPDESSSSEDEDHGPKKIVSYFTNWAQYRLSSIDGWACKFMPTNIDPSLVDVINYAFVVFDSTYSVKEYEWNDDQLIPQIVNYRKQFPNLKVFISIGGWNFNFYESTKHLFSEMAEKRENRAKFISSAISFARKYDVDGIDIDWEYPGNEDQGGREVDKESFTLLIKEFREAIESEKLAAGKNKLLLTIASPAGPKNIANMELGKIYKYLDWFNLMTYDFHGAFDGYTGPHTPLYADDGMCIDDAVTKYLEEGVPANMIMMGMAHYGRGWTMPSKDKDVMIFGVNSTGPSKKGVCTGEDGFLAKYELDNVLPTTNIFYDEKSKTMYGYYDDQFFSFDNQQTFKYKTDYLCSKKLGGVMIWSLDQDKDFVNTKFIKSQVESC